MRHFINIINCALLGAVLTLAACSQQEIMDYDLPGKVYFNETVASGTTAGDVDVDSVNYSFAVKPDNLSQDTVKINIRLLGNTADRDRVFEAEAIADSSTAREGVDFEILQGVMKANEYDSYLPVIVKRTPEIKDKEIYVTLRLKDTDDLTASTIHRIFKLRWGDMLLRPKNWPMAYWGNYNVNKYKFAISVLGQTDWPVYTRMITKQTDGYYTTTELIRDATVLNDAYSEYRRNNDPIYNIDGDASSGEIHFASGY